jgi:hypothetical protein
MAYHESLISGEIFISVSIRHNGAPPHVPTRWTRLPAEMVGLDNDWGLSDPTIYTFGI